MHVLYSPIFSQLCSAMNIENNMKITSTYVSGINATEDTAVKISAPTTAV